jgi:hypothetical protein
MCKGYSGVSYGFLWDTVLKQLIPFLQHTHYSCVLWDVQKHCADFSMHLIFYCFVFNLALYLLYLYRWLILALRNVHLSKFLPAFLPSNGNRFSSIRSTRWWWKGKVKLFLCLTNQALCREGVWESGCIDRRYLDLGASWRWVVRFTPQPLYHLGIEPPVPIW